MASKVSLHWALAQFAGGMDQGCTGLVWFVTTGEKLCDPVLVHVYVTIYDGFDMGSTSARPRLWF